MPTKKLNFSLAPINDNAVLLSGTKLTQGYSHKNGFPTIKFSIPAQDVLLDVNNLYLCGQLIVQDTDGSNINTGATVITDGVVTSGYNTNNGSSAIPKQNCINTSSWNGVASVIDKVVIHSKKTQTELQTIINYSPYNALQMGHQNNGDDYKQKICIRNLAQGQSHGFACRHLVNTPNTANSHLTSLGDKFVGQFFSIKLDVAMLKAQMIHLGNQFAGGLLITLKLAPDSSVFSSRFRKINAGTTYADITGVSYMLKNVKLEGKYAIPSQQDLATYNPVITMNSRVNLMNDLVSSENANTYTPQLQMVKGIVNTFMDDNQANNYLLNQNNFRVPVGLVQYQQGKNNIRYPNDFETKLQPNSQGSTTAGTPLTPNLNGFPSCVQGDSELRLQFGRALLGGRLSTHTSATLDLTNKSLLGDYDADSATDANTQRGDNTNPDLLGIACDYSNNINQLQNFVNQDYELKVSSGVNTGRANLPQTRANRVSIQESYIKNFSQIDLRSLVKTQ